MTEIGADFSQVDALNKKMTRFLPRWRRYHEATMEEITKEVYQDVRSNAQGRPGPNVVSGQYLASIKVDPGKRVSSDSPYGPRLEYGFTGIDSLNRHYHQPPFPHWRPAILKLRKMFGRKLKNVAIQVWQDTK